MSIDPSVRPFVVDDLGSVRLLDQQLRSAVAGQRGGAGWLAEHPALADRTPVGPLWVAVVDDVVVGFLSALRHDDSRGSIMKVDRVFVDASARELGFGDALLAACIDEARRLGCHAIEAVALPGDRDTKNLYERAGVTARSITLSREL